MTEYQIPITYVVNATAVTPQAGLEPLKLGTILILTDDEPVSALSSDYIIARNASSVGTAFGTTTTTYKMAASIFAQNPNILANDGYVIVAPYSTEVVTPATSGKLTTVDLSSNLAAIKQVSDGDLTLSINGTSVALTGLDFTGATTLDDVAEILQEEITTATVSVSSNKIVITSDTTGTTSTVTVSVTSGGSGTDLYGTSYFSGATATSVAGTNAVTGIETTATAITRIASEIYFEGVLTTKTLQDSEAINASNTIQAMGNRIFFLPSYQNSSIQAGGLFTQLQSNYYTKCLLYTYGANAAEQALNSKLFAAAYASRGLCVNYSGSNTTITMNLKDLAGISADTNISETILASCKTYGVDCFPSVEGLAKVVSNSVGGYYFDQIANRIWLVNAIQRNAFNALAQTATKIPQTETGVAILTNACRQICAEGVRNGMIAPGTWNGSDTFGVLEDFHRNIEEYGYYIYHTPVAQQAQSERTARKCPLIQVAVKEAGAIHSANILIYIEA